MDYYQKYLKYKNKYIQLKNLYGSGCKKTGRVIHNSLDGPDYSGISCTSQTPQHGVCYRNNKGECEYKEKCGNADNQSSCTSNPKGCYWTGDKCKQPTNVDCGDSSAEGNCKINPKGCFWTGNKCKQTKKVECKDSSAEGNCKRNPNGCSWKDDKCINN